MKKRRVIKKKVEVKRDPITFKVSYNDKKNVAHIIVDEDNYYANNMDSIKLKYKTYTYK